MRQKTHSILLVIFAIVLVLAWFAGQYVEHADDAKCNREEKKLRKLKDYLFSGLLPLIENPKFWNPETEAYRFYYKLENERDLVLSMAEIENEKMLVLTVKETDGTVSAEFTDVISNKSPYPITCSETLFLSDFSKKGKIELTKRYLLVLEHGLVGLMENT